MDTKGWGEGDISVNDVLKNPKKYKDDYNRINNANLKYPIIMDIKGNIYDGVHRYIKSKLLNKKIIKVYLFDNKLLDKWKFLAPKVFGKIAIFTHFPSNSSILPSFNFQLFN